ncbi:MAG: hypothetical protein EBU85_05715 [Actinobacteria bacterium]|nr:hypothetical protein [Actinomycetota bacterium]
MTADYQLKVSQDISASAPVIRDFLADLSNFSAWNPFLEMDPSAAIEVSHPSAGVGASYSWASKKIGSGVMTITAISDSTIDIHMQFTSRNKREDDVKWFLEPTSSGTTVTWSMSGKRTLAERAFVSLMRLDSVMSKHFADGLQRLKGAVEH